MTPKEIAEKLDNSTYESIYKNAEKIGTKDCIIVFGQSDDIICLQGAISDEFYDDVYFKGSEVLKDRCDAEHHCPHETKIKNSCVLMSGSFNGNTEALWGFETEIPHESFMVYDGKDKYCKGIVFSVEDLKETYNKKTLEIYN